MPICCISRAHSGSHFCLHMVGFHETAPVVSGSIVQHNSYVILNVFFVTNREHAATLMLSNFYKIKVNYSFIDGKSYITRAQHCH